MGTGRVRAVGTAALYGGLACALMAGCGGTPTVVGSPAAPRPLASVAPSPAPSGAPGWEVGARPLPKRPDGFGEVRPTPKVLRDRALPTVDLLPPPVGGRWRSSVAPISRAIRARMGASYAKGCPVPLKDLRYLRVSFRGFDGKAHTGEIIVHRRVARDVVGVFRKLFKADFPIESMRIVTTADLTAAPTGDGNNTDAFVCRVARKQTNWSAHAYGLAVDLNPFHNPYQRGDLVLPELASSYLDRSWKRAGMVYPTNAAGKAFAAIGWTWGGNWKRTIDRMHFSETGR